LLTPYFTFEFVSNGFDVLLVAVVEFEVGRPE
jgi:hypothetical protein